MLRLESVGPVGPWPGTGGAEIDLLRRVLGLGPSAGPPDEDAAAAEPDADEPAEVQEPVAQAAPSAPESPRAVVACPSCGAIIDPPPSRRRLCPSCRQPIIVRQIDGRPAFLTEAAVAVFEAERQREARERAWAASVRRWLELGETVGLSEARRLRLVQAPPSEAAVEAARRAYQAAADQAVIAARRQQRWADVARIRRAEAAAIHAALGSPVPPPDDVAGLQREGMAAVLRDLSLHATEAELVGATCCKICRADDGRVFRIATELREPRLPHAGCAKGICACDWWIAVAERKRRRR
jgi:hypothetical protein